MTKQIIVSFAAIFLLLAAGMFSILYGAGPVVQIPQNISAFPGNKVIVPINITGVQGAGIGLYALRFDYDENLLTNPVIIPEATLSQGASDLIYGSNYYDLSVGVFSFKPSDDGILIKIQFDISPEFTNGVIPISFVEPNTETVLATAGFDLVTSEFINGSIMVSTVSTDPPVSWEPDLPDIDYIELPDEDRFYTDADITLFKDTWLKTCGQSEYNSEYDLVLDCVIDFFDLAYIADYLDE